METRTYNVYKFDELTPEQQQKAIREYADFNADHVWWDCTYEDASNIGLRLTSFDLGRGSYCKGEFIGTAKDTAKLIIANHGEACETYKTAKTYLADCLRVDESEELDKEFLKSLLEDYRIILSKEYDYLTSDELIRESLIANDYWLTADGKIDTGTTDGKFALGRQQYELILDLISFGECDEIPDEATVKKAHRVAEQLNKDYDIDLLGSRSGESKP